MRQVHVARAGNQERETGNLLKQDRDCSITFSTLHQFHGKELRFLFLAISFENISPQKEFLSIVWIEMCATLQ